MSDPGSILVVDDTEVVRWVVCRALDLYGYQHHAAETVEEALAAIENHAIDAVILDLQLPDLPGTEVLRRIKGRQPRVEVIILTGHASVATAVEAIESDAFAYLEKPAASEQIIGIVRRAVEKRRLALENLRLTRQLRSANEELEAKVARRTAELAKAYEDLKALDRLKAAFIDVASHELRTPLAVIETVLAIIRENTHAGRHCSARATELAASATTRLNALATRISGFAQIDQLESRLERTAIEPKLLVENVVADVSALLESRRQKLTVEVEHDLPDVSVDANKIHDAVLNLLMNATKFTADGGDIGLSVRNVDVESVEFRVSDTGIGIAEEDKPHLFDGFFTSLDTLHHSSGDSDFETRGIGLGLAIVKKFVEMHGGKVGIESNRRTGSSFWFTLPARGADLNGASEGRSKIGRGG